MPAGQVRPQSPREAEEGVRFLLVRGLLCRPPCEAQRSGSPPSLTLSLSLSLVSPLSHSLSLSFLLFFVVVASFCFVTGFSKKAGLCDEVGQFSSSKFAPIETLSFRIIS